VLVLLKKHQEYNFNVRENNVLLDANGISATEKSKTVRHQQCWTNTLHGSAEVEENLLVRVGGESAECCPHAQPAVPEHKDTLVAENIADAAGNEDESVKE
jgi:hypothetical protein